MDSLRRTNSTRRTLTESERMEIQNISSSLNTALKHRAEATGQFLPCTMWNSQCSWSRPALCHEGAVCRSKCLGRCPPFVDTAQVNLGSHFCQADKEWRPAEPLLLPKPQHTEAEGRLWRCCSCLLNPRFSWYKEKMIWLLTGFCKWGLGSSEVLRALLRDQCCLPSGHRPSYIPQSWLFWDIG